MLPSGNSYNNDGEILSIKKVSDMGFNTEYISTKFFTNRLHQVILILVVIFCTKRIWSQGT